MEKECSLKSDVKERSVKLGKTMDGDLRCREKIDILNRDEFINHVIEIVNKVADNNGNMTFAINGEWGCGKTFVLKKIEERLENDENKKFLVIPYNCWKYDYYDEPVVAIVSALLDFNDSKNKISETTKATLKEIILNVFLGAATSILKNKTGVDVGDIAKGLKDARDLEINAENFDNYYSFKKVLSKLKEQLQKLSEEYTIVFAVDELDRCLPEYAIKVLERLHHVSEGVPNMVTIIAVDKKRLEHTVGSIFGDESADNYLKKFIKFEMCLDKGTQNPPKFFEKFTEFFKRFNESSYKELNEIDKFLQELFDDIEIRSQEQIIEKTSIIHDICFGNEKPDLTVMCMELFYSVLYYYYKTKSIFDGNHSIYRNKAVFETYNDMPEKFNKSASMFSGITSTSYEDIYDPRRLPAINSKNIFQIVIYYWYNLPLPKLEQELKNDEVYPFVHLHDNNRAILEENLAKLRKFLSFLKIIN